MDSKTSLRAQLRAERDRFAQPDPIPPPPAFLARLQPGLVVASYIPLGSEADPALLAAAAAAQGCTLALPYVTSRAAPLRFLCWKIGDPLEPGPFGLRQPPADAPAIIPDLILTPLLGFDARRNRLGQGAGHYDRAFAQFPRAWRCGVAWSVQQVPMLPADPWDVPLHAVITETGMML